MLYHGNSSTFELLSREDTTKHSSNFNLLDDNIYNKKKKNFQKNQKTGSIDAINFEKQNSEDCFYNFKHKKRGSCYTIEKSTKKKLKDNFRRSSNVESRGYNSFSRTNSITCQSNSTISNEIDDFEVKPLASNSNFNSLPKNDISNNQKNLNLNNAQSNLQSNLSNLENKIKYNQKNISQEQSNYENNCFFGLNNNNFSFNESNNSEDENTTSLSFSYINEELDELEQNELGDILGEMMPVQFGRRNRREGVVSISNSTKDENWNSNKIYSSNYSNEDAIDISSINDIDSKTSHEKQIDEKIGLKKYVKLVLPHIGLVVITCAYTLIGASIFYSVENPNEIIAKRRQLNMIYSRQTEFVSALVHLASQNHTLSNEIWAELAHLHMKDMSDQLFIAFDKYFLTSNEVKKNITKEIWTFSTALFFSVTVVTTIGYGNPVPVTQFGRMMCISFSLFGIPLTLVTIADMGKFLSERLIWVYGKYLHLKHFLRMRVISSQNRRKYHLNIKERQEHVCGDCQNRGLSNHMQVIQDQRIPALLVFGILVLYTALGGVLMSHLEPWNFFTSFYWSFITMTTVGFGDLMPRRDQYMYLILLYIILGLAITTMCIDLVGVQYIRKIHYFGRKIQDARSALAVVGGKVVMVSELYANLMQKRARNGAHDGFIIENFYVSKHIIPFTPTDIRYIRFIDQSDKSQYHSTESLCTLSSSVQDLNSCRFCHSRFSISNHTNK